MHTTDTTMKLSCGGLALDQEKLQTEYRTAVNDLVSCLMSYFGSVQIRGALHEGLRENLRFSLHTFAEGIAGVISCAYTTEALVRTREATANMFEALAAGAHVAHQTALKGESVGDVSRSFAAIAACEGRPEILARERNLNTSKHRIDADVQQP